MGFIKLIGRSKAGSIAFDELNRFEIYVASKVRVQKKLSGCRVGKFLRFASHTSNADQQHRGELQMSRKSTCACRSTSD
jgi:hypothetical protein